MGLKGSGIFLPFKGFELWVVRTGINTAGTYFTIMMRLTNRVRMVDMLDTNLFINYCTVCVAGYIYVAGIFNYAMLAIRS